MTIVYIICLPHLLFYLYARFCKKLILVETRLPHTTFRIWSL